MKGWGAELSNLGRLLRGTSRLRNCAGPASACRLSHRIRLVRAILGGCILLLHSAALWTAPLKPRIVVLTDIAPADVEPDDMESLVRLLAYADLFEIEGLIASTGWNSAGGTADWIRLIYDGIAAYERDLPNLRKRSNQETHAADESQQEIGYWPTPAYLRSVTVVGSQNRGMQFIGEANDSPGSDLIIRLADEADERPIWVLAWGGGNTLAQAVWRVQQERSGDQVRAFLRKLRVYTITDQDRSYPPTTPFPFSSHQWLRREFPDHLLFLWDEAAWLLHNATGRRNWDEYATHIQGHGHLGRIYPKYKYGVEGDTPSLLYVLPNGLNVPERPSFGGWGGFFQWGISPDGVTKAFVNQPGTRANETTRKYWHRFYSAIFNDFAVRMDWAKEGKGNRNPVVVVNGDKGFEPIELSVTPGTKVELDAAGSSDPDGDELTFTWWVLEEAGTYKRPVQITGADSPRAIVEVPADAANRSIHVICEVTDGGTPSLTSYRRIIPQVTAQRKGVQ